MEDRNMEELQSQTREGIAGEGTNNETIELAIEIMPISMSL
jgi:hypothetical protein